MSGRIKSLHKRAELKKVKYIHSWDILRNPFEIKNERQDCTMNTVCEEYFGEERG
jgi:hypothetical protein